MRVGEGLQAMLRRTPGAVVFARRMKGLFDRLVGLVVLFLQGQPRVASLGPALARDGRLTAYRIALVALCHPRRRAGRTTLLGVPALSVFSV